MLRFLSMVKRKFELYWSLIKCLQSTLLLITGFTGYISARCPVMSWDIVVGLIGSLFLTISGSTVINMIYDRDIDAKMSRTTHRPLPSRKINLKEAAIFGLFLSLIGLSWAFTLSLLYGIIIFAGLFFDIVVYTIWLKRKTAWSIVWGGIAGGMPILAGRVLGIGSIDLIGILLFLAILLWIPTHILTFSMSYNDDYHKAGIPTFPSTYGNKYTRFLIALSSVGAAVSIFMVAFALGLSWGYLRLLTVLSVGILGLAIVSITKPSEKINFGLFKYASLYMLGSMLLVILGVLK